MPISGIFMELTFLRTFCRDFSTLACPKVTQQADTESSHRYNAPALHAVAPTPLNTGTRGPAFTSDWARGTP